MVAFLHDMFYVLRGHSFFGPKEGFFALKGFFKLLARGKKRKTFGENFLLLRQPDELGGILASR